MESNVALPPRFGKMFCYESKKKKKNADISNMACFNSGLVVSLAMYTTARVH